ncbi:MAG: hypothetical protein IPO36_19205 [Anaerolineales bacterium]|nr:hypothetical protein [Anaerolineales bacterium]
MKKIFTVLLLAVFMLAQFSMASAVAVTGDASITAIPDFSSGTDVDLESWFGVVNMQRFRLADWNDCQLIATIIGTSDASGTFTCDFTTTANLASVEQW